MGPLAQLTLACGQTLPLTTLCLWLGRSGVLAGRREECSALLCAATVLIILVPMSQESGLFPRAREGEGISGRV